MPNTSSISIIHSAINNFLIPNVKHNVRNIDSMMKEWIPSFKKDLIFFSLDTMVIKFLFVFILYI